MQMKLDLRQKLGQLFMLGSDKQDPSGFVEQLAQLRAGGAILFARDIGTAEDVRGLNDAITERVQLATGIRPFIAVDQEGGRVARLRDELCPPLPANEVHGEEYLQSREAALAAVREQALTTARVLLDLHFNMNLAPVADVLTATGSEVLASRCYSSDTGTVSELASASAAQLQAAGVIATAKHFPGHGGTVVDSHLNLPVVDMPATEIERIHLPPFRRLVSEGIGAVMTAHVEYSSLDGQPATLSRRIVTELLLDEMQHTGLVVSDDMMMGAVMSTMDLPQACLKALQAGVSLVLVCSDPHQQNAAIELALEALASGDYSEQQLDAALQRNLAVKRRFGLH